MWFVNQTYLDPGSQEICNLGERDKIPDVC
jgi:hypothetical protein